MPQRSYKVTIDVPPDTNNAEIRAIIQYRLDSHFMNVTVVGPLMSAAKKRMRRQKRHEEGLASLHSREEGRHHMPQPDKGGIVTYVGPSVAYSGRLGTVIDGDENGLLWVRFADRSTLLCHPDELSPIRDEEEAAADSYEI